MHGIPRFWADSGRQKAGVLPVAVPCSWPWECTWWRCLAVLLHHLLVCHHKGFHAEALLWLASWPSGPSRAPIFIEPEIGVLCGRLRGICKEQKSIWKGHQQRPAGETDRHLNQGGGRHEGALHSSPGRWCRCTCSGTLDLICGQERLFQ